MISPINNVNFKGVYTLKKAHITKAQESVIEDIKLELNKNNVKRDFIADPIDGDKIKLARAYDLEEKGYVERRESEHDKRTLCVYPTQKMLDVLPDVRKIVEDWNAYIAADLTEEEILKFHEILEKAAARAKNYIYNKDETTI